MMGGPCPATRQWSAVAHHITVARCSWFLLEARPRPGGEARKRGRVPGPPANVARRINGTVGEASFDLHQADDLLRVELGLLCPRESLGILFGDRLLDQIGP
jgi:hypothetical protein